MGLHGASVCTALTVQDRSGVRRISCTPLATLRAALAVVRRQAPPAAIKLGMLGSEAIAAEVAGLCEALDVPVVWDPVLGAAAGSRALLRAQPQTLLRLARASHVITPNRVEAAELLALPPWQHEGPPPPAWLRAVRERWLQHGRTQAVVLKGGHAQGGRSIDWVCTRERLVALAVPRLADGAGGRVHGTGCLHASALAGALAQGGDLLQAAVQAQSRTHAAIAGAWIAADGRAMANPAAAPDSSDLPQLYDELAQSEAFARLLRPPAWYPVLPDADWVARALEAGAHTVQLRAKGLPEAELRAQVRAAVEAARAHGAQLLINDHWRLALDSGAFGVHLGQEDLPRPADLARLRRAGLRLGVSAHNPAEMARAHSLRPSYIALGPVWPTSAKLLAHPPLGLARLREWVGRCKPLYPVVGIGGISLRRAAAALDCGLDGVAVIGAVLGAADPEQALRQGQDIAQACLHWRGLAAAESAG